MTDSPVGRGVETLLDWRRAITCATLADSDSERTVAQQAGAPVGGAPRPGVAPRQASLVPLTVPEAPQAARLALGDGGQVAGRPGGIRGGAGVDRGATGAGPLLHDLLAATLAQMGYAFPAQWDPKLGIHVT